MARAVDLGGTERWRSRRHGVGAAAYQLHVPEATHHAGTAKVTSAITATRTKAVPRRVIQLLMVMRDSRLSALVSL